MTAESIRVLIIQQAINMQSNSSFVSSIQFTLEKKEIDLSFHRYEKLERSSLRERERKKNERIKVSVSELCK